MRFQRLLGMWWMKSLHGDSVCAALESSIVDERVGEVHDISAHAVLMLEIYHSIWVPLRKKSEQAHVQATFLSFLVLDQRRELKVVSDENESSRHADGSKTNRKRDLRSFVHDTVVERALSEDRMVDA